MASVNDLIRMSPTEKRTRTAVTRIMLVKRDGQWVKVKTIPTLAPLLVNAAVTGTATEFRVLAEESRELLIDRIFASRIQPPGQSGVVRPPILHAASMPTVDRDPLPHRPLSHPYVLLKARTGKDGRILLATGDYVDGIEVFRGYQRGNKGAREAGVYYMVRPADRNHVPSGLPLKKIARLLELGSARLKLPARPHWGPVVRDVIQVFKRVRTKAYRADALRRALRKVS